MTLHTPVSGRWRDRIRDALRTILGTEGSGGGLRYELDAGDTELLRGAGALYHGPDRVVNARRCLATAEEPLYAVGDVAAESLLEAGAEPALVVTDGETRRSRYDAALDLDGYATYTTDNTAGSVTAAAYEVVAEAMDDAPAHVRVEGEEDLLALAVLDHAGEGGTLLYGDPGIDGPEGLRAVDVMDAQDTVEQLLAEC